MSATAPTPQSNHANGSPFDPFLVQFLQALDELPGGYSPQANNRAMAKKLDVDPAFIEALATSARRRSLIEPFYSPARRNLMRWRVSARGRQFLTDHLEQTASA